MILEIDCNMLSILLFVIICDFSRMGQFENFLDALEVKALPYFRGILGVT